MYFSFMSRVRSWMSGLKEAGWEEARDSYCPTFQCLPGNPVQNVHLYSRCGRMLSALQRHILNGQNNYWCVSHGVKWPTQFTMLIFYDTVKNKSWPVSTFVESVEEQFTHLIIE